MSKAIIQLFCPVEGNTGFAGFISYFTSPARWTNVHESNTDFEFGDPKGNKVSPEFFRALNSTVNHQGNLSKHIREEKQHIGIVSLWIVFMELQKPIHAAVEARSKLQFLKCNKMQSV